MKIFNTLEQVNNVEPSVIALGNFDGVHLGHRAIIENAVSRAKTLGVRSAVFTFSNHPRNMIPGKKAIKNIIYGSEKAKLIEMLGVDYLFDIEFTNEIMTMSPEDYVKKLLVDKFKVVETSSGFNYRFGFKASGDDALLAELGKKYGYKTNVMEPVIIDGEVVSSTLIRGLIKSGDMDEVEKYLGRPYSIEGEVVVGNRLGKSLGFPTSNININGEIETPPNGVYVTNLIYNEVRYPSITNVGVKPTIGTFEKNMETHIFNFDSELYGKNIRVEFIKMMRDEVKFNSKEELANQIAKDCLECKAFHGIK